MDLSMDFGLSCWVILKINCIKNIVLELLQNFFFSFWGVLKTFFYLKKLYLALETLNLGEGGGFIFLKHFDLSNDLEVGYIKNSPPLPKGFPMLNKVFSINILETFDFQNNLSREPKIHWQILVNIFHNLSALHQRCVHQSSLM